MIQLFKSVKSAMECGENVVLCSILASSGSAPRGAGAKMAVFPDWSPYADLESAARAYLRDLPDAELHLLDGGHWLLETNLEEVAGLMRDFLGRVHA